MILLSMANGERWKDEAAQVDLMGRGSAGGGKMRIVNVVTVIVGLGKVGSGVT